MDKTPVKVSENNLSEHEKRDKALFDAISLKYLEKDLAPQSSIARKHRLISSLKNVAFNNYTRILEVGCGAGFSIKYLEKQYSEFVGVDYSQGLIDYANQYNSSSKTNFICANIKEYSPEEKFDVIFMIGVLHHFDDIQGILRHIVSLLKPGGVLVANEPLGSNLMIQGLRKLRTKIDGSYSDDQIQLLTKDLKGLFESVGLMEVQLFGQGYFSTPFAEVVLSPGFIFTSLVKISVGIDKMIVRVFPELGLKISWNIVASGKKSKSK